MDMLSNLSSHNMYGLFVRRFVVILVEVCKMRLKSSSFYFLLSKLFCVLCIPYTATSNTLAFNSNNTFIRKHSFVLVLPRKSQMQGFLSRTKLCPSFSIHFISQLFCPSFSRHFTSQLFCPSFSMHYIGQLFCLSFSMHFTSQLIVRPLAGISPISCFVCP